MIGVKPQNLRQIQEKGPITHKVKFKKHQALVVNRLLWRFRKTSLSYPCARGLFIISPDGKIRSIQINDNQVGRSVDEALRLVKAFQFTDKYGEVCPANWRPGEKGIKVPR